MYSIQMGSVAATCLCACSCENHAAISSLHLEWLPLVLGGFMMCDSVFHISRLLIKEKR